MDWDKYELILFNVLQNAVKYNKNQGVILIVIDCTPSQTGEENQAIFTTEIIDTGIGISEER